MNYLIRVELWCGSDETPEGLDLAEERYRKADMIARKFNINTYFEIHEENGTTYMDGYIYPHSGNVIEVLEALDETEVEYDNIDIPEILRGSKLHEELVRENPPGCGVSVNPGEIDINEPEVYMTSCMLPLRGRGWYNESYRHALASKGVRTR